MRQPHKAGCFGKARIPLEGTTSAKQKPRDAGLLVPEVGVEPTRPEGHGILSPARLPIPPLWLKRHGESYEEEPDSSNPGTLLAESNPCDSYYSTIRLYWQRIASAQGAA